MHVPFGPPPECIPAAQPELLGLAPAHPHTRMREKEARRTDGSLPSGLCVYHEIPSTQASHILAKTSAPYISSMGCLILALHLETSRTAVAEHRSTFEKDHPESSRGHRQPRTTLVELDVLLGDKGVGSPHHHLPDLIGVLRRCDQGCDASITPSQQGELGKAQSLWSKQTPI